MEAGSPEHKQRNPWLWVSIVLAVVCVGLLVWGLNTKSDLDDTKDQLAKANNELASTSESLDKAKQDLDSANQEAGRRKIVSAGALTGFKAGYEALQEELGATNESLEQTTQELEQAEKAQKEAEQQASQAKDDAKQASNATDKAKAEAEQAQAEADAAESKAQVLASCGKAFISAFGILFEGDNPQDQVPKLKDELSGVSETCKTAFAEA